PARKSVARFQRTAHQIERVRELFFEFAGPALAFTYDIHGGQSSRAHADHQIESPRQVRYEAHNDKGRYGNGGADPCKACHSPVGAWRLEYPVELPHAGELQQPTL